MDSEEINTPHEFCTHLLIKLGWNWHHPRVVDWLNRVREHYLWEPDDPLPRFVWDALSRFLLLRLKCERQLLDIGINWENAAVKDIEAKFNCSNSLTRKGYEYLNNALTKYMETHPKLKEKEVLF